ncbi:MAG: polyphosphate kinase 1 [Bacteroidales bacterium]|nr:polyphosphate kinase 1 [Bacteroidales bacterium]MDD4217350.1 polyphosphate kinase 1 [Bacteroidales bacterium]MDY0140776.1 polyphosphate kinase 1 [Bacteroidales bacterium]
MEIINREISWLHFNSRLLQEAADNTVPLLERLKFLGIYSNNLDEFYRVRVASINRLIEFNRKNYPEKVKKSEELLQEIVSYIGMRQLEFNNIKTQVLKELEQKGISILNETELNEQQQIFVKDYFHKHILPGLFTLILKRSTDLSSLPDGTIYLAVDLSKKDSDEKHEFALIQIPDDKMPRFIVLPSFENKKFVIRLDDIIRYCLSDIFGVFGYSHFNAYTIKITRDAEIDLYGNVSKSFIDIVAESIKKRKTGAPVRFIHDKNMPHPLVSLVTNCLKIKTSKNAIKGERYHNSKDFMNFPKLLGDEFVYKKIEALSHRHIKNKVRILSSVKKKDILLHYPYNSFSVIVNMLREASVDPKVKSIKITLYRLANDSKIISALINAARNGKSVTAFLELKARFDEEQNIYWTNQLEDAGVKIIKTISGIKVHSKLILIRAKENGVNYYYSNISTGNFNEKTAQLYSDLSLLTANQELCIEVGKVFYLIESAYQIINFDHLVVSPLYTRNLFMDLIENEIKNAQSGLPAWINIKLNSFTDSIFIDKIKEAAEAGVNVRISARAACSLISHTNKNLQTIGIVDKFLEHSRVYMFCNNNDNKIYIGSSDLMIRNLDTRIEVCVPIYSKEIQKELVDIFDIQFRDNTKARDWSSNEHNVIRETRETEKVRTQYEVYNYLKILNS